MKYLPSDVKKNQQLINDATRNFKVDTCQFYDC